MNSFVTRAGLLCSALLGVLVMIVPSSAQSAWCWVYFTGANKLGHEFTIIDSHGMVVPLGVMNSYYTEEEYQHSTDNQVSWISGNPWSAFADPENWNATGAWRISATDLSQAFNEHALTLSVDTQYYLYDNSTNQYSLPTSFVFEDYSYIEFRDPEMRDNWPSLPIQTIGGGLKVFGKSTYLGKVRFNAPVRIAPAGDLSMGEFTHEPAF